jgi:protein-tyrosine-phosphatase
MAEAMLRCRIERATVACTIVVGSAGLHAPSNQPASVFAQQVMRERGLDIADHRSRLLAQTDVDAADLVLTMTRQHTRAVKACFVRTENKVFQLSAMAGKDNDVEDPYGYPIEDYRSTAGEIDALLEAGLSSILATISSPR